MFFHPLLQSLLVVVGVTAVLLVLAPESARIWSALCAIAIAVIVFLNTGPNGLRPKKASETSPPPKDQLQSKQEELGFHELSPGERPIVE
jgi:hypothetical protein